MKVHIVLHYAHSFLIMVQGYAPAVISKVPHYRLLTVVPQLLQRVSRLSILKITILNDESVVLDYAERDGRLEVRLAHLRPFSVDPASTRRQLVIQIVGGARVYGLDGLALRLSLSLHVVLLRHS